MPWFMCFDMFMCMSVVCLRCLCELVCFAMCWWGLNMRFIWYVIIMLWVSDRLCRMLKRSIGDRYGTCLHLGRKGIPETQMLCTRNNMSTGLPKGKQRCRHVQRCRQDCRRAIQHVDRFLGKDLPCSTRQRDGAGGQLDSPPCRLQSIAFWALFWSCVTAVHPWNIWVSPLTRFHSEISLSFEKFSRKP